MRDVRDARKALSDSNGTIAYESVHKEKWLPARESWQPFVDVTVKPGWSSSENADYIRQHVQASNALQ